MITTTLIGAIGLVHMGEVMTLTTQRQEKRRIRRGIGLESLLDRTADMLVLVGLLVSLGLLITFSLVGLLAAIACGIGAYLQWLLIRCLAEHLRLQKKIAGLSFEGQISGEREEVVWSCGNCGQLLHAASRCESCGAEVLADKNELSPSS